MAGDVKERSVSFHVRYLSSASNLDQHFNWMEYLVGDEFKEVLKKVYESSANRKDLQAEARTVIETEIYTHNTTEGTGNIRRSMKVASSGKSPNLVVYSDIDEAPSKIPEGKFSYAAFFERTEFNSFLPPQDDPLDIKKHRPFFEHLTEIIRKRSHRLAFEAVMKSVRRHKPADKQG